MPRLFGTLSVYSRVLICFICLFQHSFSTLLVVQGRKGLYIVCQRTLELRLWPYSQNLAIAIEWDVWGDIKPEKVAQAPLHSVPAA